ncbi:uncharacterized protein UV8b_07587 [Ustilaginoidea virens]|uniref:Uncharacterized protein n=1 Tax=Ustilaginoidea virens TaxID=1159556 RepID=A0A8E5MKY6_USTVR|nr:uncharacterized protein UV8b_07587 [Ustilaginoidea virens]QUC23346.1 hypothetical protein UV8b_07587 [Ustilaginoidea virens]
MAGNAGGSMPSEPKAASWKRLPLPMAMTALSMTLIRIALVLRWCCAGLKWWCGSVVRSRTSPPSLFIPRIHGILELSTKSHARQMQQLCSALSIWR